MENVGGLEWEKRNELKESERATQIEEKSRRDEKWKGEIGKAGGE